MAEPWRRPQPYQAIDRATSALRRVLGYREVTTVSAPLADVTRGDVRVIELGTEWQRRRAWWAVWR